MKRHRLKRRLFWTAVVLALLLTYLALTVDRLAFATRDVITRKHRPGSFHLRRSYERLAALKLRRRERRSPMRRGIAATLVALVVLVVGVAPANAGFTNPYLLRLIGVSERFDFVDIGAPGESVGDSILFREGLHRWQNGRQGPKAGRLQVQCTILGRSALLNCMATAFVAKGTIVAGGWFRADANFTVPVLGGTGIYRGVGGVIKARDLSGGRTAYVFHLTR